MGDSQVMITVDTHIILWDSLRPELLSRKARDTIKKANETDGIIFCEISLWEIAMLIRKKRVQIETPYLDFVYLLKASNNFVFQGITPEIADLSAHFPPEINQDPADRIICATSICTDTPLITADKNLLKSALLKTIW
jgi:PIN domain nuclease of toxin-antitoxin system